MDMSFWSGKNVFIDELEKYCKDFFIFYYISIGYITYSTRLPSPDPGMYPEKDWTESALGRKRFPPFFPPGQCCRAVRRPKRRNDLRRAARMYAPLPMKGLFPRNGATLQNKPI